MSQFQWQPQSPYQQPMGYGYDPYAAYLAPARRAGLLMIILGGLMFAVASCCGLMSVLPRDQIEKQLQNMQQQSGQTISAETLRLGALVVAALLAGTGIPMVVLGFFVRKGGRGSTITAIVLDTLLILVSLLMIIAGKAIFWIVPLGMLILLMLWLVQALRASGHLQMMQMQYQQQYWQHMQQQQMYANQQPQSTGQPPPVPPQGPPQ